MSERHILCCDCDECLNGGSGVPMVGAGQVVRTYPAPIPSWRVGHLTGDGAELLAENNAEQRARDKRAQARKAVA